MKRVESLNKRVGRAVQTYRVSRDRPDLNNVCFHVAIQALGSRKKIENPTKLQTVSKLLLRDGLHTTHRLTVTKRTSPKCLIDFINQPRTIIEQQGFQQPKQTIGVLGLTESPNDEDHAFALIPIKHFSPRDARKTGACAVLVDSLTDGQIAHYVKPEHLKTYFDGWIHDGAKVTLWGVGTRPKPSERWRK